MKTHLQVNANHIYFTFGDCQHFRQHPYASVEEEHSIYTFYT